jgi:cytochrome P450
MQAFFLAMLIYPEVQARAAAEVQQVIGSDRLPTLADRASLPYCNAMLKELCRWSVVGPLGESMRTGQPRNDMC